MAIVSLTLPDTINGQVVIVGSAIFLVCTRTDSNFWGMSEPTMRIVCGKSKASAGMSKAGNLNPGVRNSLNVGFLMVNRTFNLVNNGISFTSVGSQSGQLSE